MNRPLKPEQIGNHLQKIIAAQCPYDIPEARLWVSAIGRNALDACGYPGASGGGHRDTHIRSGRSFVLGPEIHRVSNLLGIEGRWVRGQIQRMARAMPSDEARRLADDLDGLT